MANTTKIFRASDGDWENTEANRGLFSISRCVCELRDRVAALEAARRVEVELLLAARAQQQATTEESSVAEPSPTDPDTPQSLHRAIREPLAAPAEPGRVATDEELREAWELAPAPGGIFNSNYCLRAVYNLGRQHGAACPYIRSSDEGTSYCALAEQPAPAEPAPLPPIRVGQKWRRGDGVVAEIIKVDHPSVYSVKALHLNPTIRCAAVRSSSLYTSEGKYINDDLPRGIHPQDLAVLIEDAPAPDPAPPAPVGRLVKVLLAVEEDWSETEIRELIHGTAMWLQCVGFENSANLLRKEATR
jgi:hypothetical protein